MAARISLLERVVRAATSRAVRPPAAPPEAYRVLPWGAIDSLANEPQDETPRPAPPPIPHAVFDDVSRTPDGRPRLALLALSGGGARGAFGAGLITGWTRSGTRPRFAAVTGISTGALIGMYAFLGPHYDGELERFYTDTTDADIFADRGITGLMRDAVKDSTPLKRLLERAVDEKFLDAIAGEHLRGRRFVVGTTNLDSARLVMWDMGAIAASDRPDRLQRFRDVLLASASVPMVFPPVYFPVEWKGETYWQMHVDGGAAVIVFLSGFIIDELNRLTGLKTDRSDAVVDCYFVLNEVLGDRVPEEPVEPTLLGIAGGVVRSLSTAATVSQLVRLYRATRGMGFGFHFASIPADYPHRLPAIRFEPEKMRHLFDHSRALAAGGYPWAEHPPRIDPLEIVPHVPVAAAGPPHPPESWGARMLLRLRGWWQRQ
ncbi:MAG: patatin-like phospholipase family protein [Burkholderiales bacterium]